MEKKTKHLEMIVGIINRMAGNSFLIKGWCVTLVSALIALGSKDTNKKFFLIGYFPIITFWILDGYFLWQERLFRKLYDEVRILDENRIDFSMDTSKLRGGLSWPEAMFSKTLLLFYIIVILAVLLVMFVVVM